MYQSTENKYKPRWNRDYAQSWTSIYWLVVLLVASVIILLTALYVTMQVGFSLDHFLLLGLYPGCLKNKVSDDHSSCSSSSYAENQIKYRAECNNQKKINKLLCKQNDKATKYVIRKTPEF